MFSGFLDFAKSCEACGESFEIEDAGDGPAVFVIMIVGIVIVPFALAFQVILNMPVWLTLVIWLPILMLACVLLLRPLRGIMFNVQWANEAREVRPEDLEE